MIWSDFQDILLSEKSKIQKYLQVYYLHVRTKEIYENTCFCSLEQKKYKKDRPNTRDIGFLQGKEGKN